MQKSFTQPYNPLTLIFVSVAMVEVFTKLKEKS